MRAFAEEEGTSGVGAHAEETFALSPEQRAVLAMAGGEAAASRASLAMRVDIAGPLDRQRLKASVERARSAHDALRAAFQAVAGFRGLRQRYLSAGQAVSWWELDLRGVSDAEARTDAWLAAWRAMPLELERGELIRAGLVQLGAAHHTLIMVVSALAADAGSLRLLLEQIARRYASEDAADAEEAFQYAQFLEWRRELEQGEDAPDGRAYWTRYLGAHVTLPAPGLHYRRRGESSRGAERMRVSRVVGPELCARTARAAQAAGVPPETLLSGVWWLLLSRLAGFGVCAGGWQHDCRRDYDVMQGAIGVFEKVLPLVIDVKADESFASWVERLQRTAQAHLELQEYWAAEAPPITEHLEVGFVFRDAAVGGWRAERLEPLPCFELALQVSWADAGGELSVYADPERYSRHAIERLSLQLVTLLESALERPAALTSELRVVGEEEARALRGAHGARADFGALSVAEHVARWAEETPDAPAIEAGDQRLSYRELVQRADRLARWLVARGAGPGSLVALDLPRSADLVVAMLAAFRAGAGYLPLEPEWPGERRAALLADARPALVLHAHAASVDPAAPWLEAVIDQIDLDAVPALPVTPASLGDVAYLLFTSGSTGRPKGVVIEHRQLLNYVAAASEAMELAGARRWALTSSVVADLGNTALFGALFHGACLVIASDDALKDGAAFARFMLERRIDALKIVPSHLEALLECEAPRLPELLVLGGEAAPRSLIERVRRLAPACTIYNHYGPTETTVGVMVHRVGAEHAASDVLPLSRVLANNRVYVLDAALQLVPSGGLGEVYVGGAQVCRGYLNVEGEGRFVPDPWSPGDRLYRTGDLARVLPEGGLVLAGRADHQVKIRGFRVEPAEVEAALLAQPGVRQAAVTVQSGAAGAPELVAFLVAGVDEGAETAQQALQRRLAALLPAYMLPARYSFLPDFPRLPNGKVDRVALAAAAPAEARTQAATRPRDDLERVLARSLSELLGRDVLDVEEDFFALGVHSLLAIKLVARIRKLLEVQIAPGLLFDHPSVAALAAALRQDCGDPERLEQLASLQRGSNP